VNDNKNPCRARAGVTRGAWRRRVAAVLVSLLPFVGLTACGGGGDIAGVGTGGTGSFAVGPITGFGSVIVNGVRYDDSRASVLDDDGAPVDRSALKLGMVVEVVGSVNADRTSGSASRISFGAELKGPVTAVDATAGTVTVFGEVIRVTANTVFEDIAGGLADVAVGNVLEVYALAIANGPLEATRIERESRTVAGFGGEYRVRGVVSNLSGGGDALRFAVSSVTVTTSSATRIDGSVQEGAFVSVRLAKTSASDGSYAATRVQVRERSFGNDVGEAEIEGYVSDFTSLAQPFKVNGFPVRLDTVVTYEDGNAADLGSGVRVEVEGPVVSGVLVARKVEFERGDDDEAGEFEFKGVATCVSCGATDGTFTVLGVTLQYAATTLFEDGATPANLNGQRVEVKARAQAGPTGTIFVATRIKPDD
jgi:hypothetical protein